MKANKKSLKMRILAEMAVHFNEYRPYISGGDTILDIGTGTGFTSAYIMQQIPSIKITGLDVANHVEYPAHIPRLLYNGEHIPFPNKSFGISLIFYTLHHAQKPDQVMKEATRVTRKRIILIEEFQKPGATYEQEMEMERKTLSALGLHNEFYHNNLAQEYVISLLKKNLLHIEKTCRLPTKTPRKLEKHLFVTSMAI